MRPGTDPRSRREPAAGGSRSRAPEERPRDAFDREDSAGGELDALDGIDDAVVVGDTEARILFVNQALEDLAGVRRDALLGQALERLLPAGPWEAYRSRGYDGRTHFPDTAGVMLFLAGAAGATVPVEVRLQTMQGSRSMIVGWIRRRGR